MVRAISVRLFPKTTAKSAAALLLLATLGRGEESAATPAFSPPLDAGLMEEPADREASGLAASRRSPDVLWVLSDSGNQPVLHALDLAGRRRGRLRVDGVRNTDWEDLASFMLDGKAWLLVADCGDNRAERGACVLHVVAEPDPTALSVDREISARPAYSINYIYEDTARDCEAVAVDPAERMVYLLSKRDVPARLYRLPLRAAPAAQPAAARSIGRVPHLPQPNAIQKAMPLPLLAFLGEPTGMDFSADGRLAVVLTYGGVELFPRATGETWADALARAPVELASHLLPQAEGVCFTRDARSIFVCSEETMKWTRYDRRER